MIATTAQQRITKLHTSAISEVFGVFGV